MKKRFVLGFFALVACAIHLSAIIPILPQLTTDEAFSWRVATSADLGQAIEMTGRDVHPPLYYMALWGWVRVWGQSEVALRLLSGLCSLATLLAVVWYARIWSGPCAKETISTMSWVAVSLVALSQAQIYMAHNARMYALLGLLTVLSCGQLLLALRNPGSWKWWTCYALTAAALLYTHNYGIFCVTFQGCWVIFETIRLPKETRRGPLLVKSMATFALVAILYIPWIPWLFWQTEQVRAEYWIQPTGWENIAVVPIQFTHPPTNQLPPVPWYVTISLGLFTLVLFWPWRMSQGEFQLGFIFGLQLLGITAIGWILGRSIFVPRYLTHLLPLAAVPVAYWIARVPDVFVRRALSAGLIGSFVGGLCVLISERLESSSDGPAIKQTVSELVQRSAADETIIVTDRSNYLVFRYYLKDVRPSQPCLLFDPRLAESDQKHVVFASAIPPADVWRFEDFSSATEGRYWIIGLTPDVPAGWRRTYEDSFFDRSDNLVVFLSGYDVKKASNPK